MNDYGKCPKCNGKGVIVETHNWTESKTYICDMCNGNGNVATIIGEVKKWTLKKN